MVSYLIESEEFKFFNNLEAVERPPGRIHVQLTYVSSSDGNIQRVLDKYSHAYRQRHRPRGTKLKGRICFPHYYLPLYSTSTSPRRSFTSEDSSGYTLATLTVGREKSASLHERCLEHFYETMHEATLIYLSWRM